MNGSKRIINAIKSKSKISYEEVKIPVPWGHIAGKWWGVQDKRPVLALHGWLDNCGSFDRLIPLLPKNVGYLAIDLPGHGRSSNIPPGGFYGCINNIITIKLIKQFFKWETMSFLSHSVSAIAAYNYGFVHPSTVDFIICLDGMQADRNPLNTALTRETLDTFIKFEWRNATSSVGKRPSYTFEELERKLYEASNQSIDLDKCKYILERNSVPVKDAPGQYQFSADPRLRSWDLINWSGEVHREAVKLLTFPVMLTITHKKDEYIGVKTNSFVDIWRYSKLFEAHELEGTHHAHLNHPEMFSGLITEFMKKHDTNDRSWIFDLDSIKV